MISNLNRKLKESDRSQILEDYKKTPEIKDTRIGAIQKNGKIFTYERAFSHYYATLYGVTQTHIFNIIKKHNVQKK